MDDRVTGQARTGRSVQISETTSGTCRRRLARKWCAALPGLGKVFAVAVVAVGSPVVEPA